MLAWPASVMPSINMRLKNRVVLLITIPIPIPKIEMELGNTDAVTERRRMICKIPLLNAWKF
jgi:hypothetical protein